MAACPVAKGQPFGLYAREAHNIACWFTKTIGGGILVKLSQCLAPEVSYA